MGEPVCLHGLGRRHMITIMPITPLQLLDGLPHITLDCQDGETLFMTGEPVRWLFVVADGEVRLIRRHPNGHTLTLHRARAGDMVAEASVFADHYHCEATVIAPTRLLRLDRNIFRQHLARTPESGLAWAECLAHGLRQARARAEILSLKTVRERLDAWSTLTQTDNGETLSWKAVAEELGVSPEALYRELARRRQGSP